METGVCPVRTLLFHLDAQFGRRVLRDAGLPRRQRGRPGAHLPRAQPRGGRGIPRLLRAGSTRTRRWGPPTSRLRTTSATCWRSSCHDRRIPRSLMRRGARSREASPAATPCGRTCWNAGWPNWAGTCTMSITSCVSRARRCRRARAAPAAECRIAELYPLARFVEDGDAHIMIARDADYPLAAFRAVLQPGDGDAGLRFLAGFSSLCDDFSRLRVTADQAAFAYGCLEPQTCGRYLGHGHGLLRRLVVRRRAPAPARST